MVIFFSLSEHKWKKYVDWRFLKTHFFIRIIINSFIYPLILVVSLLTYMITKGELSPEEINGMALDMIKDGVDTVSAMLQLTYL